MKPANTELVSVYEKEELEAQKAYYAKIREEMGAQRTRKLALLRRLSVAYIPFLALIFAALYWIIGLKKVNII